MKTINKTQNRINNNYSQYLLLLLIPAAFILGDIFVSSYESKEFKNINKEQKPLIIPPRTPSIKPDEVYDLSNRERINAGLKPLTRSQKLDEAALQRAKAIIQYNEWAHEATKSGLTYKEAIRKTNYWNINYGENLANGQYTSQEVVSGWMNSPKHKENLLSKLYQEVGIATFSGQLDGFHTVVTVQIFGGYQPPNYSRETLDSWSNVLNRLKEIKPSWENLKNNHEKYEANKADTDRLLQIIDIRISRMESIVSKMNANKWMSVEENKWMDEDKKLYDEQQQLASKLNSR